MKAETAVTIVNTSIVLMVVLCTLGVAWLTGTAQGLWSLLAMMFFMSTSSEPDNDDDETRETVEVAGLEREARQGGAKEMTEQS